MSYKKCVYNIYKTNCVYVYTKLYKYKFNIHISFVITKLVAFWNVTCFMVLPSKHRPSVASSTCQSIRLASVQQRSTYLKWETWMIIPICKWLLIKWWFASPSRLGLLIFFNCLSFFLLDDFHDSTPENPRSPWKIGALRETTFLLGRPIFRRELLVSGGLNIFQ